MKAMKAYAKLSDAPGDISLTHVPVPEPAEHQVRIQVKAMGVGIHDGYFLPTGISYPYPIGIEGAGVIEAIGSKVSRHQIGQRVAFISAMQVKGGVWAEFAVVEEDALIIPIPDGMSFEAAAAVPVAGNTVLRAFQDLNMQPCQSIFIAGASGAIGSFAIQLAVQQGCRVVASASARNHDYMRSLGAAETVDYHDADWPLQVRRWQPEGVDAALAIQPNTGQTSMSVVRDRGRLVLVSGDQAIPERNIQVMQISHRTDIEGDLIALYRQIMDKQVRLEIEKVFGFHNALEALQKTQTRRARGKLVVRMD